MNFVEAIQVIGDELNRGRQDLKCEFRVIQDALASLNILIVLKNIDAKLETIMATQAEVVATLKEVVAQQKKTQSEIVTLQGSVDTLKKQIADLEKQIAEGVVGQELADAVAEVKAQAQIVDDQIPDVPTPTPVP